jgi:hypothetical protein
LNNVADILAILDDHGFIDTDTNTKLAYLNNAITEFCSVEPWPFLEAQPATLSFDGTHSYPSAGMPTNFRAVLSVVDSSTGRLIIPERVDNLDRAQGSLTTQQSDALFYYFIGNQLNFAPIPPASFQARLRYLQFHPDVTSSSVAADFLIPKRFWMALVFGALVRLYDQDDDPDTSERMRGHFNNFVQTVRDEIWQRQFDMPDRVVITDPDYLIDFPI